MARTIEEIEQEILIAKNSNPVLQEINTNSRFSPWKAIVYVMAFVVYSLEQLFTLFKEDITEIITNNRLGSLPWYAEVSKVFQLGDQLNQELTYNTINTDLQIISRVAVKELDDATLSIKVAKGKTQNELAPLTVAQRAQFEAYMNKIKPAGVKIKVKSLIADKIKLEAKVFYDPLFAESRIKEQLNTAINKYCNTIDFGGELNRNDLIGRVRQEKGINDFIINKLEAIRSDDVITVDRSEELEAGYAIFSETKSSFEFMAE